jgi:FlaA1/EpsC-like NDP-sugar epimerase
MSMRARCGRPTTLWKLRLAKLAQISAREEDKMARLENKVVIVTGGAQSLGEGIARRLAEEGASVVIADINGPKPNRSPTA